MSVDVNREEARKILAQAFKNPIEQKDLIGRTITDILRGTHKTYRYVLFTALLAKATNDEIDILSLQKKDPSKGSYDARSLCHSVVVPFERNEVPHSLGDSNEPFLNKPARFVRLSESNAVRGGNDKKVLLSLIETLPKIKGKNEAFKYLSSAVFTLIELNKEYESKFNIELFSQSFESIQMVLDYIDLATERTCEGETCPLIVAALESMCSPMFCVIAHKVNESGASSKEVGDIDVFETSDTGERAKLYSSIEVKDKDFSELDVQHAISKFHSAGLTKALFVYGKSAHFDSVPVKQLSARYGRSGIYCAVVSIMEYAKLRLYDTRPNITLPSFMDRVSYFAKAINAKEETMGWLNQALKEL